MNQSFSSWLSSNRQLIIDLRRWLHQHPELGFEEKKTKDSSKVTQTIETIGKVSVDEEKLRKKFKGEGKKI